MPATLEGAQQRILVRKILAENAGRLGWFLEFHNEHLERHHVALRLGY